MTDADKVADYIRSCEQRGVITAEEARTALAALLLAVAQPED